jgi:hypothetical protein
LLRDALQSRDADDMLELYAEDAKQDALELAQERQVLDVHGP